MSLTLFYHPLASFCHKVLIALYENGTPFAGQIVDLMQADENARFLEIWPVGKIPVLRDEVRDVTLPETSIINEHLDLRYPGRDALVPRDAAAALETRLWDRFYDWYVQVPMQKIVVDRLRPPAERDPCGVADAKSGLAVAYGMIEERMATRTFACGNAFSMADCAAAPALFYAGIAAPFPADHGHLAAYFERLLARPSVARTYAEARPFVELFPLKDEIPERLRTWLGGL
jgi:glutathione S-transferase